MLIKKEYHSLAQAFSEAMIKRYKEARKCSQNFRLLVPAITPRFGQQLQARLLESEIFSYLVVNKGEPTSEEDRIISTAATTALRKDSIIYIVPLDLIATLHDSIKQVVKECATKSEWPWDDRGLDYLQFGTSILPELINAWGLKGSEYETAIEKIIGKGIVPDLKIISKRRTILIDDSIGNFEPTKQDPQAIFKEFLMHAGIPFDEMAFSDPGNFIQKARLLLKKIGNEIKENTNIRRTIIGESLPRLGLPDEIEKAKLLELFFDGLGVEQTLPGVLTLRGGFSSSFDEQEELWEWLSLDILEELFFPVEEGNGDRKASLRIDEANPQPGVTSRNYKVVLANHGDEIPLSFRYDYGLPVEPFNPEGDLQLRIFKGTQLLLDDVNLGNWSGPVSVHLPTEGIASYTRGFNVTCRIFKRGEVEASVSIKLQLVGESRPLLIAVGEKLQTVTPEEIDQVVEVDSPSYIFIGQFDEQLVHAVAVDDEELLFNQQSNFFTSRNPVDPNSSHNGFAHVEITYPNSDIEITSFTIRSGDVEEGEFTLDNAFEKALTGGKTQAAVEINDRLFGRNKDFYEKLGNLTTPNRNRSLLASYFDCKETGHLPVFSDLFNPIPEFPRIPEVEKGYFRIACNQNLLEGFSFNEPEQGVKEAITNYKSCRTEVVSFIKDLVNNIPTSNLSHPVYTYTPAWNYSKEHAISDLLVNYLTSFNLLNEEIGKAKMWGSKFAGLNLDCIIHHGGGTSIGGVKLLGPWHPVVLTYRYLLQKSLATFATSHVIPKTHRLRFNKFTPLLRKQLPVHCLPTCFKKGIEPAILKPGSDSGWIVSIGEGFLTDLQAGGSSHDQGMLVNNFFSLIGLPLVNSLNEINASIPSLIERFIRNFSTRRHLNLDFGMGYEFDDIHESLSGLLFEEDLETRNSKLLPGGVHSTINLMEPTEDQKEKMQSKNNLFFYKNVSGGKTKTNDITFLPSTDLVSMVDPVSRNRLEVVRGKNNSVLLSSQETDINNQASGWVGSMGITESEFASSDDNLYNTIMQSLLQSQELIGRNVKLASKNCIPEDVLSRWLYIPGVNLDPALVRHYLNNNGTNRVRSLWDYHIDIVGSKNTSYYVISQINKNVGDSIRNLMPRVCGEPDDMLREMAQLGIALEGESQKSLNKAKGCIGLVGAARLVTVQKNRHGVLLNSKNSAGMIIPVDSFKSILGWSIEDPGSHTKKMCDLLAIQLWWSGDSPKQVKISALGIEAKFKKGDPADGWIGKSLRQARHTFDRFKEIVQESRHESGHPIRLALLKLIHFGLRLGAETNDSTWVIKQKIIIQAILNGELRWEEPTVPGITVLTRPDITSESKIASIKSEGHLVTLSRNDWPKPSNDTSEESDAIMGIRNEIKNIFSVPLDKIEKENEIPRVEGTGTDRAPEPDKGNTGVDPTPESSIGDTGTERTPEIEIDVDETGPRLTKGQLDKRYIQIIEALRELNISIQEPSITHKETPSSVQYYVKPSVRDVKKLKQQSEALHYALGLGNEQAVGFKTDQGRVIIDAPKNEEERYNIYASRLWKEWEELHDPNVLQVPIGKSHTGELVKINFSDCAHLLIGGQTGSGKSEGIKAIITGLAHFYTKDQLKFLLVDGKQGVELDKFSNLPHCEERVGENARDAIQSMQNARGEMNDRYQSFRRENVTDIFTYNQKVSAANRLPWWIVILDEYAQLGAVKEDKESIEHHLQQLGQMARAAGIHVIISTQKPTAEVINNVLKENLVGRLAFRVTAGTSSQVILDEPGAEILNGKGDAFFRDLKGTQRFQCCLVSNSTLDTVLS